MSKFSLDLSLKNIKILKHSLERRIEEEKPFYDALKRVDDENLIDASKDFIKEHEDHVRCLDALVNEMKIKGERHGQNIFGEKYA